MLKHILWVNDKVHFAGGCEMYIHDTHLYLKKRGIKSSVLYGCFEKVDSDFIASFDQAYPAAFVKKQVELIKPDIIYVHNVSDSLMVSDLIDSKIPVVRFFHDHKFFCLREHKYTGFTKLTCTKKVGLNCYYCPGFIQRSSGKIPFKIVTLSQIFKDMKMHQRLAGVITGSDYMKEHIVSHGFEEEKVFSVPLYYDRNIQNGLVQKENGKTVFMFAGQLLMGKGIDTLIKAAALMKKDCLIYVFGQGHQEALFKKMAEKLKVTNKVVFKGKVPRQELEKYYQRADAFVFPVRTPETFALVGLEAMSYGLPVIAPLIGGITQWLEDDKNAVVLSPNNHFTLAKILDDVVENPQKYEKMGEYAKGTVKKFSSKKHIDSLIEIFEKICTKKN